ncbi:hypothetical protein N7499_013040 [Penicillium canescens]|nr:hypothetical protein N7499_013040 [Penicillium canescens]KAJ6154142.1 hypothetical protein N7485_012511 [Penicillium canescens]
MEPIAVRDHLYCVLDREGTVRKRPKATKEDNYWLVTKHYEALVCVYME